MDDLSLFVPSNLLHNQEKMNRYHPGGFHPVMLGGTFKAGRYTVYHKLGYGGFSIVWLARDQSGANLVFTAHGLEGLSAKDVFEVIGAPVTEKLARLDGKVLASSLLKQLVKKVGWDEWVDEDEEDVRLIDFGEAFAHGAEPDQLAEPSGLEVPEKIFTGKFDYRIDLWRVGCTVRRPKPSYLKDGCLT
ncbi:hypothetical protein C8A03DRAFT_34293 [Achaetomium macrosporum]|uniref:non-specific serine/threonine protein kinase n=1 Tax=Achaetomium macrosporum TaxID=79813 RepID=A0AAN7C972_9PEZI|nr:hypothetical protein C8A03DRAFT_34293 [Achaetomium macrosporum]